VCKTREETAASMKSTSHERCGEWRRQDPVRGNTKLHESCLISVMVK